MIRTVATALLLLLSPALACGQVYRFEGQNATFQSPAGPQKGTAYGTCFCVGQWDGKDVYLTAGHCVSGRPWPCYVHLESGKVAVEQIRYTYNEGRGDIGVLLAPVSGAKYLPLATEMPKPGQAATLMGFHDDDPMRVTQTSIARYCQMSNGVDMMLSAPPVKGESGGPVIVDGKAVGIISATDSLDGYATSINKVLAFFSSQTTRQQPAAVQSHGSVGVGANVAGVPFGVGVGVRSGFS